MKRFGLFLFNVSVMAVMPVIAGAAGTYYNGNLYQNPQLKGGGYYNTYGAGRGYGQGMQDMGTNKNVDQKSKKSEKSSNKKQGFQFDVNYSYESANWNFEMSEAKSKLHYDDLAWNVLSGNGVYYFDTETPMQINFGARYGMQFGESPMVDDDVSNGPYGTATNIYGDLVSGYAISAGTSKSGKQMGFNMAFGLTDFFKVGKMKITPSVGYRYFKYELEASNSSGMMMDIVSTSDNCDVDGGQTRCGPFVNLGPFYYQKGVDSDGNPVWGYIPAEDSNGDEVVDEYGNVVPFYVYLIKGEYDVSEFDGVIPDGAQIMELNFGDTLYYHQSGISHKYETEWAGPYVALDMEYEISDNNSMTAGLEFGLPMYTAKGDQPYRPDWLHPTSVEDKGGLGDAYHLGLNANWKTKISESMDFNLGLTYDYYMVDGADSKTYLNQSYYKTMLDYGYIVQEQYDELAAINWVAESKDEIKSVYKSMGIRAGLSFKF